MNSGMIPEYITLKKREHLMTSSEGPKNSDEIMNHFNPSRYWDYLLGGFYNFEVDRKVADHVMQVSPDIRLGALANRSFLRRAVRFIANQGITQFLDLGSGLPTVGPVHEVAQGVNPDCRTIYVDHDPIAVTHSQSILAENPKTLTLEEDIRNIEKIFENRKFKEMIDLGQPIAVLLIAVLHFIKEDAIAEDILNLIRSRIASGSYLVISHFTLEAAPSPIFEQLSRLSGTSSDPTKPRSLVEVTGFFNGFELLEPGVVWIPLWRPEGSDEILVQEPERALGYCGVGRKG
jgi:hypothetical protein